MTLQEVLDSIDDTKTYRVIFYELDRDFGGWSVNRPWVHNNKATKKQIKEHLRCRLLVFRENYLKPKRQKVTFQYSRFAGDYFLEIECNGIPFANIEENE